TTVAFASTAAGVVSTVATLGASVGDFPHPAMIETARLIAVRTVAVLMAGSFEVLKRGDLRPLSAGVFCRVERSQVFPGGCSRLFRPQNHLHRDGARVKGTRPYRQR